MVISHTTPKSRMPAVEMSLPGAHGLLWMLWIGALILGIWGIFQRITLGHLPAGYGSYVPWGLWVALYFHGVGIAGGAFVLGAGGFILDLPGFRSRAMLRTTIVLSFAAIVPAFMGVWFDLGHMERSHFIFLSPSFTSMMAFNAWMYQTFMAVASICWVLSFKRESVWLKPLLCTALLFSVLFPSQSGAFFGVVDAKPFWHSALLPMLFLASAITAGSAVLLVVRSILGPVGNTSQDLDDHYMAIRRLRLVTIVGLCVYFVFEFAEFSIALWNPMSHAPEIDLILWGPYWWVFWVVHMLIGGVLALLLLVGSKPRAWAAGALIVGVTFVSTRLNVLVPGQSIGEIRGLQEAFTDDRLRYTYHATSMEYALGFFLLAVGITVFFLGLQLGRLVESRFPNLQPGE